MARKPARELSAAERALWQKVAGTATPLAKRSRQERLRDGVAPSALPMDRSATTEATEPHFFELATGAPVSKPQTNVEPISGIPKKVMSASGPPTSGLDRRTGQRLRRGQVEADATVDLHGLTQERAHHTLVRFIHQAQERGYRLVLVITGKGKAEFAPVDAFDRGRRGVLRHAVPEWLSAPDLRGYVIGYQRAHQRHGGDGALYVRIRRQR